MSDLASLFTDHNAPLLGRYLCPIVCHALYLLAYDMRLSTTMDEDDEHQSKPISGERHFQKVDNEDVIKTRWDQSALNGNYSRAPPYECVKVLLLSWRMECCDNLDTAEEIDKLKDVFQNMFHYDIQRKYLCRHACTSVQVQLNHIVSDFVNIPEGPNTLFIVYYAGHAIPASTSLELLLHTG